MEVNCSSRAQINYRDQICCPSSRQVVDSWLFPTYLDKYGWTLSYLSSFAQYDRHKDETNLPIPFSRSLKEKLAWTSCVVESYYYLFFLRSALILRYTTSLMANYYYQATTSMLLELLVV